MTSHVTVDDVTKQQWRAAGLCPSEFDNDFINHFGHQYPKECIDNGLLSRDLVSETATQLHSTVISEDLHCTGSLTGRTSGAFGTADIQNPSKVDWFRIVGGNPDIDAKIVCELWVIDVFRDVEQIALIIPIFESCLLGTCLCKHFISGVRAQLRPCRAFAECYCRGGVDPDWDYILRGICFGFKVIDAVCNSSYNLENYNSILKKGVSEVMSIKLNKELEEEMITRVAVPCVCIHPFGAVPKGHDDFRAIVDCSSPDGTCVNNFTEGCRNNFSYKSVEDVTELMQKGDFLAITDIHSAYRAVNIHSCCREKQGLAWDFKDGGGKYF